MYKDLTEEQKEYQRQASRKSYQVHKEKRMAYAKAYREKNRKLVNEKARLYRASNPEKVKELARKRYYSDPEAELKRNKEYREKNKERLRQQHIARTYGLNAETYEKLKAKHDGQCAICAKKPKQLFIDHNHTNGAVRGLLCQSCNQMIGFAFDNVETMQKGIDYLRSYE